MVECLPSKQVVAGSSPVSRSKAILTTCLTPRSVASQLARYRLDAGARGYSEATIQHTERSVRAFAAFCGGIGDVALVSADDLRRFIISLKERAPRLRGWRENRLSPTSVNTYVRAVRAFWGWLEQSGALARNPLARVPAPRYPRKVARVDREEQLQTLLRYFAGLEMRWAAWRLSTRFDRRSGLSWHREDRE